MKLPKHSLIILILIVGTILRVYNLGSIPFTFDELSALVRLDFNSFSDLIEYGIKVDGHPAGVHVFLYYWTMLFGTSEWVVKLPFILSGIGAIYLIYRIGKFWFNETVGLISAAFIASLQFTIMYSQIARPYTSGLFLSLFMVYYWSKLVKKPEEGFVKNAILFVLGAVLCSYNHHFSLLFAAIVGISGIFIIPKKYLLKYALLGGAIFILYIPHLSVFFAQIKYGGIEGWLAKPSPDFLIDFVYYGLNFSFVSLLLVIGLIVFGIPKKYRGRIPFRSIFLFAIWFLLPYLIGHFYSIKYSAILQYSVLIFSFPFLFFVLFGHISERKTRTNMLLVLLILVVNIFGTIVVRQHYSLFYKAPLEMIIVDSQTTLKPGDKMLSMLDSDKAKTNYYYEKYQVDSNFVWIEDFASHQELTNFLSKQSEVYDYLYLGTLSGNHPITVPLIQQYFPTIVWQKDYTGATNYLFSKKEPTKHKYISELNFEDSTEYWTPLTETAIIDTLSFTGEHAYFLDSLTEWSPTFQAPLYNFIDHENNFVDIYVKAYKQGDNLEKAVVAASLELNGESIWWGGTDFKSVIPSTLKEDDQWVTGIHSIKLSDIDIDDPNIELKVYVWNQGHQNIILDDINIQLRDGNSILYGRFEPVP